MRTDRIAVNDLVQERSLDTVFISQSISKSPSQPVSFLKVSTPPDCSVLDGTTACWVCSMHESIIESTNPGSTGLPATISPTSW